MNKLKTFLFTAIVFVFLGLVSLSGCKKESKIEEPNNDVDFTYTEVSPGKIVFTNQSKTGDHFIWNFGDEVEGTGDSVITHSYFKPGSYTVSLIAYLGGSTKGSKSKTIQITNTTPPTKVYFKGVELTRINLMDGDNDNSGPDMYYRFYKDWGVLFTEKVKDNIRFEEWPVKKLLSVGRELTPMNGNFSVQFYEENRFLPDDDSDEFNFSPTGYQPGNYPTKLSFAYSEISGNIFLEWE